MKNILYFILTFFCITIVKELSGQTKNPLTIMELFAMETNCPLPNPSPQKIQQEEVENAVMDPEYEIMPITPKKKPKDPAPVSDTRDQFNKLKSFLKNTKINYSSNPFGNRSFIQNENLLWELKNEKGELLETFQSISIIDSTLFTGKKSGQPGLNLYNEKGKPILSENYSKIGPIRDANHYFYIRKDSKIGIVHKNGETSIPVKYDNIQFIKNDYWIATQGKTQGVLTSDNKTVVPFKYTKIKTWLAENGILYSFAERKNGELTIYKDNKKLYDLGIKFYQYAKANIYEDRYLYYYNQFIDLKENTYLFCNSKLEITKHDRANHLYSIRQGRREILFNGKGEVLSEKPVFIPGSKLFFNQGEAVVCFGGVMSYDPLQSKCGILNDQLNWVLPAEYSFLKLMDIKNNSYLVSSNLKKFGVINNKGENIIPEEYSEIMFTGDNFLAYPSGNAHKAEVFDLNGKFIFKTEIPFEKIRTNRVAYEGRELGNGNKVLLNHQFKKINKEYFSNAYKFGKQGIWLETITTPKSHKIIDYNGNPYPLKIEGKDRTDIKTIRKAYKSHFIVELSDGKKYLFNSDTKKSNPINPNINHINDAFLKSHGLLISSKDFRKNMGIIDTLGREILPPDYGAISGHGDMIFILNKGKRYVFSGKGEQKFTKYESAYYLANNLFGVMKNDKWGIVNTLGEVILPLKYKNIRKSYKSEIEILPHSGKMFKLNAHGDKI